MALTEVWSRGLANSYHVGLFVFLFANQFGDSYIFSNSCRAQDIEIPFNWKMGESYAYKISEKEVDSKGRAKNRTRRVTLKVMKDAEDHIVVNWKLGQADVPPGALQDPAVQKIAAAFEGLELEMEIGKDGVYRRILNWEKLDRANKMLFESMEEMIKEVKLPQDAKDKVFEMVKTQYGNRTAIENRITEPLNMMLLMTATSFSPGKVENYESESASGFGGVVTSREKYELLSVDKEAKKATVFWSQELDPEQMKKEVQKYLQKMEAQLGKTGKTTKVEQAQVRFQGRFELDLTSGWPLRIEYDAIKAIGRSRSQKTTTIEKLPSVAD